MILDTGPTEHADRGYIPDFETSGPMVCKSSDQLLDDVIGPGPLAGRS